MAARSTKPTKRPKERKGELLEAARAVFARKGISNATVDDITARAGVSKGTFYLYFKSKDQIVGSLWEQYVEGFLEITETALADDGKQRVWHAVLWKIFEQLVGHALQHAELHRVIYRSADAQALEFCRRINQKVIARITEAVRDGVDSGQIKLSQPELMARLLYHGTDGVLHDAIMSVTGLNETEVLRAVRELYIKVFDAPTGTTNL